MVAAKIPPKGKPIRLIPMAKLLYWWGKETITPLLVDGKRRLTPKPVKAARIRILLYVGAKAWQMLKKPIDVTPNRIP